MCVLNMDELFIRCVNDGFPIEVLSRVLQIKPEKLRRIYRGESAREVIHNTNEYNYFGVFLMQLYCVSALDNDYIPSLIDALITYFGLNKTTIANYIGVSEAVLDDIATQPTDKRDRYNSDEKTDKKIMHLFVTFVRDKRYSIE